MIRRTFDASFMNEVANHPDVRPWIGGEGPADLTAIIENPANVCLVAERNGAQMGGWVFRPILPSSYEVHTLFLPQHRGAAFYAAAREGFRYMFAETDALEILTKCPDDNPGARMASSQLGFRERFHREDAWSHGVGISFRVFSVDDWFVRDPECLRQGRAFHEALEAAKAAADSTLAVHPEDATHDRAVGAAALMILAGQTGKGVGFYSRWAIFAGYATIDVRDALVEIRDGRMGVLKCRSLVPPP